MTSNQNNSAAFCPFGPGSEFAEIRVELVAEKKGVFIKHVEYEVYSGRYTVTRRYNDFGVLHDILLAYFPNRLIPRLPPKKAITDQAFIDERKKALGRYLTILNRNQVIRTNHIFSHFLSYAGSDLTGSLKSLHKAGTDEFGSFPQAAYDQIRVSDWNERLATWKSNMTLVERGILKLLATLEMVCQTSKDHVRNYMALNLDLSNLCEPGASPFLDFLTHQNAVMRNPGTDVISDVASEIAGVTKQWLELANAEESNAMECIMVIKDLLKGWKDLFARQDKTASADQKALNKGSPSSGKSSPNKMDERASNVATVESRLKFGLYCITQEMDFLQLNLAPLMTSFLRTFVKGEKFYAAKIAVAWEDVSSVIDIFPPTGSKGPSAPPPPDNGFEKY